jgi:hypothetical protein
MARTITFITRPQMGMGRKAQEKKINPNIHFFDLSKKQVFRAAFAHTLVIAFPRARILNCFKTGPR